MPNKAITGWTQVPVAAKDLRSVHYDRAAADGSVMQVTVHHDIRDDQDVVRMTGTLSQQVGAYPVSLAAILSACNTAQGT